MVRLSKRKNKTGFWAVLIIGLVLLVTGAGPLIGGIIGLFLGRGAEKFLCGVCYMKYEENLLGSESVHEGKICRFCPDKKLKRN
jgi:hypothetical protein